GQFHRANWREAANINLSNIRPQQSTVAVTGTTMAVLRNNNLATTECYALIIEPFVNSKSCDYLPTFDVTRESSAKVFELLEAVMACFNSSWEQDSEAGLDRRDMRVSRMSNVHIHIPPHATLRDVAQIILKDCGQTLDRTMPAKFRNRKFPTVYLEGHLDLDKV
ncbi:hypothetical protein R3P38DRAFT_2541949, partial [Favolaschia claudopus]